VSSPVALPPVAAQPQPPTLLTVIAAPAPADSPTVTLAGSPQALAALASLADPSSFTGTIATGNSAGSLALVTSFGTFALDNAPSLAVGAQLTLQTVANTPGSVAILTIDAVPTTGATPIQSGTTLPAPTGLAEAPPTIVDLGTLVTATVIAAVATAAANEVAAARTLDAATALEPTPGTASTTEQIAPVLATSPSDPTRDATASPSLDIRSNPGPAGPDGARSATLPGGASVLATAAAAALDDVISSGRLDARQMLAGTPWTDNRAGGAQGRDRAIVGGAPSSDAAPAAAAPSLPAGTRALPVGASLILRILAFQTVAAPGAASPTLPGPTVEGPTVEGPTVKGPTVDGPALSGVVRAAGPAGAIVETAIGPLRLSPAPPLPPGAQIALRLLPGEPATATLTVVSETPPEANTGELPSPPGSPQTTASERPAPLQEPLATPPSAVAAAPGPAPSSPAAGRSGPVDTFITRIFIAPSATGASAAPRAVIGTILDEAAAAPAAASLVETAFGVLAVAPRLALPPGTLLLLAAQDAPLPLDALFSGRTTSFERGWPALQAAIGTLSHTAPTLAAHLLADLAAHDGETLAASLLFLVATLRSGGPAAWPGDAVERALALAGRDDLKQRLGEDVGELRRIAADPATGHWQVFLLPVHDGTALRPVRLYLARRDKRGTKDRRDEDNSRFVLEFELSRIGALQLDGFIRRRRFDLALRSHVRLAPALRADIARIFHARIAAAGLTGEIDFATVARFDIAPLDALHGHVGLAV
jgi:hypothetical protein